MVARNLIKYGTLILGFLFIYIFLSDLKNRGGIIELSSHGLFRFPCQEIKKVIKLKKSGLYMSCQKMNVIVDMEIKKFDKKKLNSIKKVMYQQLFENLKFMAHNSPQKELEKVEMVIFNIYSDYVIISSQLTAKNLIELKNLNQAQLLNFLKKNIQVKESFK